MKVRNKIERSSSLFEAKHKPILFVNSFWSRLYAYSIKHSYVLLYDIPLCGWQKHPSTVLSCGLALYSACKSTFETKEKFIYVWNTNNKTLQGAVPVKHDTFVRNFEHFGNNCVLVEEKHSVKIKRLLKVEELTLQDVKEFPLGDLK